MKIEIKHYDMTHTVDMNDGSTTDEVLDQMINLVISTGFSFENIRDWIMDKADEYARDN